MPKHAAKGQPSQPKVRAVKPAKKVQLVVRKEKTTRSAAVKKIQHSGPKAHAITSTQKAKTVQKKKAALPVLAKKTRPLRSKVRVVTQTKKAQSAQKEKITEIAHKERVDQRPVIEKTRASRSKVHAVTQAKKAQPVQKEKEVPPALIKKVSLVRSRKVPSAKKEKIAEIAQKEKAVLQSAIRKTRSPRSKTRPVTQGKTTKPVPIKKITPSKPVRNVQPVRPAAPVPSKKRRDDTAGGARKARPRTLLKNVRPIWTEKIKPPEPVVRSVITGKAQLIQPEKTFQPAQRNVTPEIKIRAGKFVHLMEKSDAYIHYKKNGKSSKISEFDFRSLLLCTMESSPETLARNVEKFKGYAGIHNRQDLVVFLNFCAEKLSYLLAPQIKRSTKPARRKMK
ncbi:MAG: hypothetical protein MUO77_21785 [Anaerolineales bacterium]|nr:hypothetical protein [Anaerolineales bacterium]